MKTFAPNQLALNLNNIHLELNSLAGSVQILKGISMKIHAGETIGLIGASGSGKTSLLMVIAGLEAISKGLIEINGKSILNKNEDQLALFRRHNIGIIFQNFHLVPTMTAIENIALPLEFSGIRQPFKIAAEQLDLVGLSARAQHYPGQLSGGEQQRIAVARAFSTSPPILLADEPTGSLDKITGNEITDLLFNLQNKYKTTMIIVTHSPELASRCKRIISLENGKVSTSNV